jgi:hypothetical protein
MKQVGKIPYLFSIRIIILRRNRCKHVPGVPLNHRMMLSCVSDARVIYENFRQLPLHCRSLKIIPGLSISESVLEMTPAPHVTLNRVPIPRITFRSCRIPAVPMNTAAGVSTSHFWGSYSHKIFGVDVPLRSVLVLNH